MKADAGGAVTGRAWIDLAAITCLAVFFHTFMEWLFFATKPSFLSALSLREKLPLPGAAAFTLFVPALLAFGVFVLMGLLASGDRIRKNLLAASRGVPSLVLALSFLVLIDNFTHTLFGWGIHTLRGPVRHLYALPLAALAVAAWRTVRSFARSLEGGGPRKRATALAAAAAVLLYSAGAALAGRTDSAQPRESRTAKAGARRPNILLLGSDGLEASHLSLYAHRRETTPFLDAFARQALVGENAFPNAGNTGGSLTSLLTGRLPTRIRVVCPPDILRGDDSYLHLPLLLKQLGYRTAQLTVRHYADAADLNLREGFDQANFRPLRGAQRITVFIGLSGQTGGYFLQQMSERITSRLSHVFTAREWTDPYSEVTANRAEAHGDSERLEELLAFLGSEDRRPFFAHVHLMGTHGGTFAPKERHFSRGREQTESWMADFYDDAIRDFDRSLARIVDFLERRGELEETVVILYSDHGMRYSTAVRLPLVFRFPGGAHAGRLSAVVQNLDVAPTLLDYLGVETPDWMEGRSLLRPDLPPCGWVLSVTAKPQVRVSKGVWASLPSPPFYSLGKLSLLAGGRHFSLDLATGRLQETAVELTGRAAVCVPPAASQARELLIDHLRHQRYDVSSLAALR